MATAMAMAMATITMARKPPDAAVIALPLHRWLIGGALAVTGVFAAYRAFDDARFAYLRNASPEAAQKLRPTDAAALGRYLDQKTMRDPNARVSPAEAARIRTGLSYAPLTRRALRALAVEAAGREDMQAAERAMSLSDAVSRRDAPTQLWLIERAVGREDVPGALEHYHRVMAVHPEMEQVLLPILANAISAPEVRNALAPYVARQTPWAIDMLETAAEKGASKDAALLLLPITQNIRTPAFQNALSRNLIALVQQGELPLALKLIGGVWPDLRQAAVSFPVTTETADTRLGLLGWSLSNAGPIIAIPNGAGGFEVTMQSLANGHVASRVVPVTGGTSFTFEHRAKALDGKSLGELKWQVLCLPVPKALVASKALSAAAVDSFKMQINVPAECKALSFELSARGADEGGSSSFVLEDLKLTKL